MIVAAQCRRLRDGSGSSSGGGRGAAKPRLGTSGSKSSAKRGKDSAEKSETSTSKVLGLFSSKTKGKT